ncbi:MAG: PDZ domain-containing protein [Planctomycetota bacterium]
MFRLIAVSTIVFAVSFFSHAGIAQAQDQADEERQRLIAVLTETLDRLQSLEVEPRPEAYSRLVAELLSRDPAGRYYYNASENQMRWLQVRDYLAEDYEVSPYWIGVQCEPVEEVQLLVNEDTTITATGGLLVSSVVDDSPAQAAGLQAEDVILFFNGNSTTTLPQLVNAINSAEGNESQLSVIREMALLKIELEPALRETAEDTEPEFQQALILNTWGNQLPEGYSADIRLRLTADNGNWWEANSSEIDTLPAEAREYATYLFQRSDEVLTPALQYRELYDLSERLPSATYWHSATDAGEEDGSADRLAAIEQKLDELTQMLHELKSDQ